MNDIDAQIITVVDVSGLSMGGLAPQSIEFATKSLALIQAHYPARAQVRACSTKCTKPCLFRDIKPPVGLNQTSTHPPPN